MTVPNSPEGWERVGNLRKAVKNTPICVALYGRHPDRKSVAKRLFESSNKSRPEEAIHLDLRRSIPLKLSETVRVYLRPRPTRRLVENERGEVYFVPTKWAK
jgi:hypothetical protein